MTTNEGTPRNATKLPWKAADQRRDGDGHRDREHALHLPALVGDLELGDDDARDPGDVADREVDLAEQEHEDDADRDRRHPRHLGHEVREVAGAQVVLVLPVEERDDADQPEDDRERSDVARPEQVEAPPDDVPEAVRGRDGVDRLRIGGRHAGASASGIPATFVATPAVIAWTTSCWVVVRRS